VTGLLFAVGLVALIGGAELLVRGAGRLALALGVSPLVIGLTVVAFGTSSPEIAVSVGATMKGQVDLAVGNVVGSNIFNVLFILGVSALITPLVVAQQLIRQEVPLMIGVSLLLFVFAHDGVVSRPEAGMLFAGMIAYTVFLVRQGRAETSPDVKAEYDQEFSGRRQGGRGSTVVNVALVVVGLALLVIGSRWLVDGAVAFARHFGVSETVIGLTIVAAGTSLPEVASSVVAAVRGERDIAVGNVIGSNMFNILGCLGLAGLVGTSPLAIASSIIAFDLPMMLAVAVACLPIFLTGATVARWEGGLFLGYYLAYTAYVILAATRHDALPLFSGVMLGFVVPLTIVTLTLVAVRAAGKLSGRTPP
jgi:cation:H+ antiporter